MQDYLKTNRKKHLKVLRSWIQTNYSEGKLPARPSCTEHSKFKIDSGVIFSYREFCELWDEAVDDKVVVLSSFYCNNYSYLILQTDFVDKLDNFIKPFHIKSSSIHSIASNRVIIRFFTPDTKDYDLIDFIIKSFREELNRCEMY